MYTSNANDAQHGVPASSSNDFDSSRNGKPSPFGFAQSADSDHSSVATLSTTQSYPVSASSATGASFAGIEDKWHGTDFYEVGSDVSHQSAVEQPVAWSASTAYKEHGSYRNAGDDPASGSDVTGQHVTLSSPIDDMYSQRPDTDPKPAQIRRRPLPYTAHQQGGGSDYVAYRAPRDDTAQPRDVRTPRAQFESGAATTNT